MKDDNNGRQENSKVLFMEKYQRSGRKETNISQMSIHQLLDHMRQVRESVPVNRQLQEELRQNLVGKKTNLNESQPVYSSMTGNERRINGNFPRWILVGLLSLVLVLAAFAVWYKSKGTVLQPVGNPTTVTRVWNLDANLSFSVSPGGDILVARHGQLLYVEQSRGRYRLLDLPVDWMYHSPSFSPDGSRVALVRQRQGTGPQIVLLSASQLLHGRAEDMQIMEQGGIDQQFRYLAWSPGGEKLAYTEINEDGIASIKTVNMDGDTQLVTRGTHPTWSPDGTTLVIQRSGPENGGVLYLIDTVSGKESKLGQGEQPFWGSNGFLSFVVATQQERVLTFMPDGSPQFTVRQRVGEIRSVHAGTDGSCLLEQKDTAIDNWLTSSTLLVSPDNGVSGIETEWLRKLELEGVREPRVLLLDGVNRCQDPILNVQGNRLFFTRQDGGTAAILRLDLEERLSKRGEN